MNARATMTAEGRDQLLDALDTLWRDRPGPLGWFATIDHKRIAIRYAVTAAACLLLDGAMALLLRSQLAEAEHDLLDPMAFLRLAEMHGAIALLLVLAPLLQAVAVYLVPLMVGARAIAFPRLNAFGYWTYLGAALVGLAVFAAGSWRATPASASVAWIAAAAGVSALCVALGVFATILRMRAPGMTLSRMPTFVWAMLLASIAVLVVVPGSVLDMVLERRLPSTSLAAPSHALLVSLALLPTLGILAGIVEATARRAAGYAWVNLALLATGVAIVGGWAVSALAPGIAASQGWRIAMLASFGVPGGVLAACWISTLCRRAWRADGGVMPEPLLFALGAMALLALGGVAVAASVPGLLPRDFAGTQYAVAALHCLAGGAMFALFGALHAWFPKVTGRMLSGQIARLQFALLFAGFLAAFLPLFWLGSQGMPRRVGTYAAGLGWTLPNTVATLGTWMMAGGLVLLAFNLLYGRRNGRPGGDNPWRAPDLAWATHSPPPPYNFPATPTVRDRHPGWEQGVVLHPDDGALQRTTALTTPVRAAPRGDAAVPRPNLFPPIAAFALIGLAAWMQSTLHASAWAVLVAAAVLLAWWRQRRMRPVSESGRGAQ